MVDLAMVAIFLYTESPSPAAPFVAIFIVVAILLLLAVASWVRRITTRKGRHER